MRLKKKVLRREKFQKFGNTSSENFFSAVMMTQLDTSSAVIPHEQLDLNFAPKKSDFLKYYKVHVLCK